MTRRIERSFRGISERLAIRYLTNLGGERVESAAEATPTPTPTPTRTPDHDSVDSDYERDDDHDHDAPRDGTPPTVVGDTWQATLSSESVQIGPTLTLTEVTVVFEGQESAPLETLVEDFAQKAMRAGG
ncbi:ubiquitin-like protein [Natrialba magadii ATCC 43099]|uniref:Ubiquitin-like protein n=1 Tax=Natrialba magadii (strain ATCC 43099 / DSM 3394 / CCM 3739 / CIP 104546 / IAM 13178 / JCM 8861 / NBRC 102185 / NCIMB 2190 / MS3) TaxID=547559 RepID=D3SZ31_NATMM|nr:hypothetical protein [Natrialba magadii]ADD06223.1 ubiquitin-like protein [Natrialba magadii ATCC 43099]ELY31062.1 hypothetical protein C500_07056 [Natrialba magadii ATCC 43099]